MKIWVLNLVGVSLMGILLEILLPTGKTNKYIKGVLALVTVYVVVSPIIKIFNNEISIKNFFTTDIVIDEEFIFKTSQSYFEKEEKRLEDILEKNGIENVKVNIVQSINSQNKIEFVKICTKNMTLKKDYSNIDIIGKIEEIVKSRLKIDSGRIYYE